MRWAKATVAAMMVTLAASGSCLASRPATDVERAAMAFNVADLQRRPQCAEATVSTVDPAWGLLRRTCDPDGGPTLVNWHPAGVWFVVAPEESLGADTLCSRLGVATAVGVDLGVCAPLSRSRFVLCWTFPGEYFQPRVRPSTCGDGSGAHLSAWRLVRMRWTRWAQQEAVAHAKLTPNHYAGPRHPNRPVVVRFSEVRYPCGPRLPVFSKVMFTARKWSARTRGWDGKMQDVSRPAAKWVARVPVDQLDCEQ